jgi:cellulose synthase/poly-beta-1,6-N-acetylglucosamine synthase-like glycosyltransferase
MPLALEIAFWLAVLLLGYLYVGYPLAAWLRARVSPRPHRREPIAPVVTVVVVAYNEADRIEGRIRNLLDLEYPAERLDFIIASDGSTDDTAERARTHAGARLAVRAFPVRRGKAAVLNDVVPSARGDIVVLGDARQRFEPASLNALVSNFADPSVGAVSGELMLTAGTTAAGDGAGFYWRYEKFMRRCESCSDSTFGVTGAIYAIRRALFEPVPADTILDDVLIPLRIVRRGYRVLFDARARAIDRAPATGRQEFVRKARTIAGTFQLFCRESWIMSPGRNRIWFQTVSHKGLRLVAPLLHVVVLACGVGLRDLPPYRLMLFAQAAFCGAALAGWAQGHRTPHLRIVTVPYAICLMNWATIVAFVRFVTGRQQAVWDRVMPAPRPPPTRTLSRS